MSVKQAQFSMYIDKVSAMCIGDEYRLGISDLYR